MSDDQEDHEAEFQALIGPIQKEVVENAVGALYDEAIIGTFGMMPPDLDAMLGLTLPSTNIMEMDPYDVQALVHFAESVLHMFHEIRVEGS